MRLQRATCHCYAFLACALRIAVWVGCRLVGLDARICYCSVLGIMLSAVVVESGGCLKMYVSEMVFAVIVAFIVCHANLLVCLADTGVPNNALHRFLISQRAPCYCYAFLMCALVIRGVGWPLGSWDGRAVRLADCEGPG